MSIVSEVRITIRGARGLSIAASETGPRGVLPVILSHGGGQTRFAWGRTAQLLAAHGFHTLSLDLRGHGESDWVAEGGVYDIADYAEDIRLVIASLSRPPLLVGASLGGIASLLAAGESPFPNIAGLCLVDVSPHLRPKGVAGILGFMKQTSGGFDSPAHAAAAIAAYLPHRPPPADLDGLRRNLRRKENGRYYWHWDPRTIASPLRPEEINPRIEVAALHVAVPALLLRGEHSELVTHEVAERFMNTFNHGRVREIAGARHMIAGDRNDLFGQTLLEFANTLRDVNAPTIAV
jgi:pimeloyl-ACP methyl ester carboxylesterase